jgi:ABC-type uncharacterized transport system auxiliary subunit
MKRSIPWIVLALSVCGCSVVKAPERTQWTTFVIDPAPAVVPAENLSHATDGGGASPGALVLRVAPIASGPGYDTSRMAYVESSGTLEYFARHRWAEPPSAMLAPVLVAALEQSRRFAAVVDPSSRAVGDASLESELLTFRMEVDGAPRFHVVLRASIVSAVDRRPLAAARTFDVVEPAQEAAAPAGAAAARAVAARLAQDVAAWCTEVVTPR